MRGHLDSMLHLLSTGCWIVHQTGLDFDEPYYRAEELPPFFEIGFISYVPIIKSLNRLKLEAAHWQRESMPLSVCEPR